MASSFYLKDLKVAGWGWPLFVGIVVACGSFTIYYPLSGAVNLIAISEPTFIIGVFLSIKETSSLRKCSI